MKFHQLILMPFLFITAAASPAFAQERWAVPFDVTSADVIREDSLLTFQEIVELVADRNPGLKALPLELDAARHRLRQAGMWPNPELEAEIEEVGWEAPGIKESELSISLSQEFELFGQRRARRGLSQAGVYATEFQTKLSAFDLYLETKERFYVLAHALESFRLTGISVRLAEHVFENINLRIGKGAALQAEQLMAQLELQRAELERADAEQELYAAKISLGALWGGETAAAALEPVPEPDFNLVLVRLEALAGESDSTRHVLRLLHKADIIKAQRRLAMAEARPSLRFTGGYKRLQGSDSNSLLFGVAVPLPLWDRNQHNRRSLDAQLQSAQHEIEQARLETKVSLRSGVARLRHLVERHTTLESTLLPVAEDAYTSMHSTYRAGRIPYTSLLEAERSLVGLRFEHNDLVLSILLQIIELERIVGLTVCAVTDEGARL